MCGVVLNVLLALEWILIVTGKDYMRDLNNAQ